MTFERLLLTPLLQQTLNLEAGVSAYELPRLGQNESWELRRWPGWRPPYRASDGVGRPGRLPVQAGGGQEAACASLVRRGKCGRRLAV